MNELSSYSFVLRTILSVYMNSLGVELFITRTVHEILWGFKDPLLTKIHNARPQVDEYFGLMWKVSMSICFFISEEMHRGGSHVMRWLRVRCLWLRDLTEVRLV